MNRIIILGGRERGSYLLDACVREGLKVVAISPMHLYPEEEGLNNQFMETAGKYGIRILDKSVFLTPPDESLLTELNVDIVVSENWRRIIPDSWSQATGGLWIFHESLLPKYRGFAPLAWPILNGDKEFGVTLFEAVAEMDAGPIVAQERLLIEPQDTCATLYHKTFPVYYSLLKSGLERQARGIKPIPQNEDEATYTVPLLPQDGRIMWSETAQGILRKIRAFTRPYSGAWCLFQGKRVTIWEAREAAGGAKIAGRFPGRVVQMPGESEIRCVCTADGVLELLEIAVENEGPVSPGSILTTPKITLE